MVIAGFEFAYDTQDVEALGKIALGQSAVPDHGSAQQGWVEVVLVVISLVL